MSVAINLTGQRLGRLLVLERTAPHPDRTVHWVCLCECGNTTTVGGGQLRRGHTRSCGCLARELSRVREVTHGHSRERNPTPEYLSWKAMNARCNNPNSPDFPNYGGRGITVCARWDSFENFLADMGQRPEGKTLDRYPNMNGNYEPGNCWWSTPKEQANNRR
jgi:hypothetical protein